MLPHAVFSTIESHLGAVVKGDRPVSGGCIANAARVDTDQGPVFVKWNRDDIARTFPAETDGLRAMRQARSPLRIPNPLYVQEARSGDPGVLIMEWIESGKQPQDFWAEFGRGLATLHRHTADRYGFERDNYIGRLPQRNKWQETWPEFFTTQRLQPQVALARDRGKWDPSWESSLERLFVSIESLLPRNPGASILHGDLWSGNFLACEDGRAAIVDPAAYFGHREADLAMTELFGGFDASFYAAYREEWPLDSGYPERRDVYNLYHLINHLNHFGGGYGSAVAQIVRKF